MAGEKSRTRIALDYNRAKKQAASLEEAAANIRRESNRVRSCKADVAHSWQGDNASRFTGKMSLAAEDLDKIARQLERAAGVVRKNARNIYDAEMEAKRLADMRNHS